MIRQNKELTKIVAASLLGDGTVNRESNKNGRFKVRQLASHKDHLDYLSGYLEALTRITYDYQEEKPAIIVGKETTQHAAITLRTMAHPFYTNFRERMYGTGKKCVDPHYLTLLDFESLAIWYQQDGYVENMRKDCNLPSAVLCTDNFSYGDHVLLRHALIEKTGLIWNIRAKSVNAVGDKTYRLYLSSKQFETFREKVYPYMQSSFYYKLLSNVERRASV